MADRSHAIRAIFDQAAELSDPEARWAFVAEACGPDEGLRREIEELLAADETAGGFLADRAPMVRHPEGTALEAAGARVGRYKLLQKIGEGGCGIVYMAEQTEPVRRRVALKVIKLGMDTRSVIARFEAERQALALMDHPNIAKVLDAGATETGRPFFVMELVRGTRITAYCDQNKLPTSERLKLFVQVCQAIQHAHQKGIIHRDIKPSNLLVTVQDGIPVPKVIDFGIAKATTDLRLTDKTLFTQFELFIGTPAYMSPEQADLNASDIDTRSDVYSLGVLLYELLTGRTPFDSAALLQSGLDAMRRTIRETEPQRPSTRLRTLAAADLTQVAAHRCADPPHLLTLVRGDLDWIVLKALEKERGRRYATANELAMDVQRYLAQEPISARPKSTAYELQKLVRRNKVLFSAAGAIGAALLVGLTVSGALYVREQRARQRAVAAEWEQSQLREQEVHQRQETESANQHLAHTLFIRDWQDAETLLEQGKTGNSLAWFAQAIRKRPELSAAATRLISILSEHNFAFPVSRPLMHSASVLTAGFSADGQDIVTAADDGAVRIWRLGAEALPVVLSNHFTTPAAAFMQGDTRLFVMDFKSLSAWKPEGTELSRAALRVGPRRLFALAARGHYAALSGDTQKAQLWDLESLRPVGVPIAGDGGELRVLAASPDGRFLIRNLGDTMLGAWDVRSGRCVWLAAPPQAVALDALRCCDVSPDGRYIAGGYLEGRLVVWKFEPAADDVVTRPGADLPVLDLRLDLQVTDVRFTPNGERLYAGTLDGMVRVCPLDGSQSLPGHIEHEGQINAIQVAPDGGRIVTASADRTAQVWDVRMGMPAPRIHKTGFSVYDVKYSPDSSWFVMGGRPAAEILDANTGALRRRLGAGSFVSLVDVARDGSHVATATDSGIVQVWDAQEGWAIGKPINLAAPPTDLGFSPDGRWLVVGDSQGAVWVYDAATGTLVLPRLTNQASVVRAVFSPDGRMVLAVTEQGQVTFWHLPSGTRLGEVGRHKDVVWTACFSRDGRYALTASSDRTARLWDAATARPLHDFRHEKAVFNAAFSHDDGLVITGCADHTARVWNRESSLPMGEPMRHSGDVWYGEFSPDDRFVLTGDDRGNARVWESSSGLPLSGWIHNGRSLKAARLRPDGHQALSAAVDGLVRVWPVVIAPSPAPFWLPDLSEAVAGLRLSDRNSIESVSGEQLRALRLRLTRASGNNFYARWTRWFLVDRMQENPPAFSP